MYLIEENTEEIKYGAVGKSIRIPKFPIRFSPILSRIAGHIIGDGGIICKKSNYTVYYSNKRKELIAQFKNDVIEIFGDVKPSYTYFKKKNAMQKFQVRRGCKIY